MATSIAFTPASHDRMSCEVRSPLGYRLTMSGTVDEVELSQYFANVKLK